MIAAGQYNWDVERAGEVGFDFALRVSLVLLTELHAYTGNTPAAHTLRGHPDHRSRNRNLFLLAHQVEQHKDLVTETIRTTGWNEQATVDYIRHVGQVQGRFVLDGQCE